MVGDRHLNPSSGLAKTPILVPLVSAVSVTDGNIAVIRPGFDFAVEKVEVFARTYTATLTVDVLVGSNVIVNDQAPTANTRVEATWNTGFTSLPSRKGTSSQDLTVRYTSNGTGAVVNGYVLVWIRPFPAGGEV